MRRTFRGQRLASRLQGYPWNRRDPTSTAIVAVWLQGKTKAAYGKGRWESDSLIVVKKPAKDRNESERVERRGEPSRELFGGKDEPYTEMETHLPGTPESAGKGESQATGTVYQSCTLCNSGSFTDGV